MDLSIESETQFQKCNKEGYIMKDKKKIIAPVGLAGPRKEIENVCDKAAVYRIGGIRPMHFIVPLDSGEGRTTLLEYMTDKYKDAGVMDFSCGLDDYIEVVLDGSLHQLREAFASIDDAAIFDNEYRNIIGMDISGISGHLGEVQLTEFLENCRKVCEKACVVFFVHSNPTAKEEKLLEKLCEAIGGKNVKRLKIEPYTAKELRDFVARDIEDKGIEVKHVRKFSAALDKALSELGITSIKDASDFVRTIIWHGNFRGGNCFVDETSVEAVTKTYEVSISKGREVVK